MPNNNNNNRWRGPPPGVRANALARARELVAAHQSTNTTRRRTGRLRLPTTLVANNQRRTLNTRLVNLQRRYNNLERLRTSTLSVIDPSQWNTLGNGAESLYQYIRNHNLQGFATGGWVQHLYRLRQIATAATRYGSEQNNNSARANNNNRNAIARARANRNAASYAAGPPPPNDPYLVQQNNYAGGDGRNEAMNAMKNASNKFKLKTTWGRRANKNTASAWYNQTTKKIKKMNHSVINNIIGQNKFRPGPINGNTQLYFDANDPKRHLFTKNGMVGSRGLNPYYGKNIHMRPYLLPRDVNQELFRFMATREQKAQKAARRPRITRNANNFYNSNTNNVGGVKRKRNANNNTPVKRAKSGGK